MRKNRLNKGKSNRQNKLIMIISIFVVCVLFAAVGIKFTQRAKASSEAENKFKIQSITANENIKKQNNNSNDQEKNISNNAAKTNDNSTGNTSPADNKSNNGTSSNANNENNVKPAEQSSPSNNGENSIPASQSNSPGTANQIPSGNKVAYLTFDDGPSTTVTPKILDILKKENVQATFFVIGSLAEKNPDLLRREKAEGHSIGNHTYSHNYNYIYSSTNNFINDLKKSDNVLTSIIGDYDKSLIRFPGGSFNRQSYKQAVQNAGYRYVDWNCLNGDAEVSLASVDRLVLRFNQTFENQDNLIILMHDAPAKKTTPQALPQIIQILKSKGYTFKGL